MPVPVDFKVLLIACNPSIRTADPQSFVNKLSGEVLFVKDGDPVMKEHFPRMPPGRVLAAVKAAADVWLAIPKNQGRVADLGKFVREWCAENGFATA